MDQLSFNFDDAKAYMLTMLHLEAQRDEVTTAINEARTLARNAGVPTKAVEATLKAAKSKQKALDLLAPTEFAQLMVEAERLLATQAAVGEERAQHV